MGASLTDGERWKLDQRDDEKLRAWQRSHLCASWFVIAKPWEHETLAIDTLQPPLNVKGNRGNPYAERFRLAMGLVKAQAQARAVYRIP